MMQLGLVIGQTKVVETVEFAERLKRIEERLGIRAAADNGHAKPLSRCRKEGRPDAALIVERPAQVHRGKHEHGP
jgi:hypothetical protein